MSTIGTDTRSESALGGRRRAGWIALITAGALMASSLLAVAPAGAAKGPSGTLAVETPGVTVLKKGADTFTKGKDDQKIAVGDTVQTDATGLAQITFKDGTLTRLDNDTVFTLDVLSNKTGTRAVEGTVSAGQTWNRVQKLSESETFEQKGNGATAAVLGTAFLTKCSLPAGTAFKAVKTKKALKKLQKSSRCEFTLVDGKLTLTSLGKSVGLNRGQSVGVDAAGAAGNAVTIPPDILFTDPWITSNLQLDAQQGVAEAIGTPTAEDLKQARIEGSWPVVLQVTGTTGFRDLTGGTTRNRTYVFTSSCSGGACTITLTAQTADGTRTIPLTYADGTYTGSDPDLGTQDCLLDDGSIAVPGGIKNSNTISFTPTNAVPQNGLWSATGIGGTVTETATQVAGGAGQCRTGSATFSLTASR